MVRSGIRPDPTVVDASFHAMEEVNEVARASGWRGEYRQLGKGPVTFGWRSLHLGQSSIISQSLNNRVEARVAPPRGCVALAIVPPPSYLLVEGKKFASDHVLLADADVDVVTPNEASCDILVLPRSGLEASGQALFPEMRENGRLTRLMPCPSSGWSALKGGMTSLLRNSGVSSEDLSLLLCQFLDLMAGETMTHTTRLGNGSTRRVVKMAQDYIEGHYSSPIRMEDICRCTGVSLRTLQRYFSEYFQVTPFQYIKARRFNAARQALVTGDSSCDSIARVAFDHGFTHLGRFSVDYRKQFLESPKETLARHWPSAW